ILSENFSSLKLAFGNFKFKPCGLVWSVFGDEVFPPPIAQNAIVRNGKTKKGITIIIFLFRKKACDFFTLSILLILFVIDKFPLTSLCCQPIPASSVKCYLVA